MMTQLHYSRQIHLEPSARRALQECFKLIKSHPWWRKTGVVQAFMRILDERPLNGNDSTEFRNKEFNLRPRPRSWQRGYYVEFYVCSKDDPQRLVVSQRGDIFYFPMHWEGDCVVLFDAGLLAD